MKLYTKITDKCEEQDRNSESWFQEWSFNVDNIYASEITKNQGFEVFDLPVSVGDKVWSLVIRYNDGDSLGTARNKGELVWLFTTEESAKDAKAQYLDAIENEDNLVEIMVELGDDCKVIEVGNLINDYFVKLSIFEINEHIVKK